MALAVCWIGRFWAAVARVGSHVVAAATVLDRLQSGADGVSGPGPGEERDRLVKSFSAVMVSCADHGSPVDLLRPFNAE